MSSMQGCNIHMYDNEEYDANDDIIDDGMSYDVDNDDNDGKNKIIL